jgi:hypothetical protein
MSMNCDISNTNTHSTKTPLLKRLVGSLYEDCSDFGEKLGMTLAVIVFILLFLLVALAKLKEWSLRLW